MTGCCYKNCERDIIPQSAYEHTIQSSDGWELVSASLAEEAEDVYEVVCDFGDAVCDYADSDVGKAVDVIAKIGARVPGQVGAASRAYSAVKKTLTRAFLCREGDSISCAVSHALLNSGAPRTGPIATAGVAAGTVLAASQCAL